MNVLGRLKLVLVDRTKSLFKVNDEQLARFEFKINAGGDDNFGDVSCNVAMIIAKIVGRTPREIAAQLQQELIKGDCADIVASSTIAGPGFLNITLTPQAWRILLGELYVQGKNFFANEPDMPARKYLIEFVSANPTGPLHLGHGRGGIIGDVLARVLSFVGHQVHKEFYINDAGNQIKLLGQSLKARCLQELGQAVELPEGGYAGTYLVDMAKDCIAEQGEKIAEKSDQFFELYAKENLLDLIKATLAEYRITFDRWYSEKTLHDSGVIERVLTLMKSKDLVYEQEGALWFRSTLFGDDKDRVIRKSNGELTYIAADIAYHKDKFDRGHDTLIDILGHDHHGYVKRLKATMASLGYNADNLEVILYQLVTIKEGDVVVKMSKRAGTFTELADVMRTVGVDVARFFFLNRKSDAPLDFDLATALKKTDENPVYYIQYSYVRINSLFTKAAAQGFDGWIDQLRNGRMQNNDFDMVMAQISSEEHTLLKKVVALRDVLNSIVTTQQTHLLSYYALDLAQKLHAYYTKNKIIDTDKPELTRARLCMVFMVHRTLATVLDLLGLTQPEKM
ncbi:MAG: arginine--tRNA ligase [Candidatus Babeliales bacterium]|jgi:arginyl-tRNA synthetase